jgi:signal transduction histidine kinase
MFSMHDYSIPRKLSRMNMLVSGTALLLASAGLFVYDVYGFRTSTVRDLAIQAQIIGSNSIAAVVFSDPAAADKTLSALRAAPHVISAEILTPDGHSFAAYRRERTSMLPLPLAIPADRDQAYRFQTDEIGLARTILFEGKPTATVYIRSDLGALRDRIRNFSLIVTAVLLLSLVAAMWLSRSTRRSIAEPIVHLAETAQIVLNEKNYSVRAPATSAKNEIGVLISSFNEMLAQIQQRDAALEDARDHLEHQVLDRTAQLNAANADLEAFSYSVSHDLRAPLRHISGFSQLLSEEYGPKMEPEAQRYLQRIQTGVRNMGMLVDDLLKMARIGRKELVVTATDLNELVKQVVCELQPDCVGRQIEWRIAELSPANCDPGLMKQVFANLLSNAVKYSRKQEAAIIDVGEMMEEGDRVLFVRDNGAGFDEKYADKLFGIFQRLHKAEDFEGTGVGLSTVQRIIKKHGGEIWAKGEVGKGATFFFALTGRSRRAPAAKAAGAH